MLFVVFTAGAAFASTATAVVAVAATALCIMANEVAVRDGKMPKLLTPPLLVLLLLGASLMVREMDIGSLMGLLNLAWSCEAVSAGALEDVWSGGDEGAVLIDIQEGTQTATRKVCPQESTL